MTTKAAKQFVVAAMEARGDNGYSLPKVEYASSEYIYKVRDILPEKWYIVVYYKNPNGTKGGLCRLLDELDGPDCSAKVFQSRYKAQKYLNQMAEACGWEIFEGG